MAIKVQALWDICHGCKLIESDVPDGFNLSDNVWEELLDTDGIHEPHWFERNKYRFAQNQTLDEYYQYHQKGVSNR
jgi:hypothetical protein